VRVAVALSAAKLLFILHGTADMTVRGKHTSTLRPGAFPNCLAFQRACWRDDTARTASHTDLFWPAAYGTVTCRGEVEALVWHKTDLFALLDAVRHVDRTSPSLVPPSSCVTSLGHSLDHRVLGARHAAAHGPHRR
jgi:hypothetical protein